MRSFLHYILILASSPLSMCAPKSAGIGAQLEEREEPAQWIGPNGNVNRGTFQLFILPAWSQPPRSLASTFLIKHSTAATLEVFVQDGSHYKQAGPLKIDCDKPQNEWQYFPPGQINANFGINIQSGHACGGPDDKNLDNINIKYGSVVINAQKERRDGGKCDRHDGGVSCLVPFL